MTFIARHWTPSRIFKYRYIYKGETATGKWPLLRLDQSEWHIDPGKWQVFGCNQGDQCR